MYGLKYAHLIKELSKADVYEFYIDMRCFGEGYEEFYKRLSEERVNFIQGKVAKITDEALTDEEKGKLIVVSEDTLLGKLVRVPVDMVILCSALEARSDAENVAKLFTLNRRADGFFWRGMSSSILWLLQRTAFLSLAAVRAREIFLIL